MGCDIHMHTEVRINGCWYLYSKPDIGRNYDLFHILGNEGRGSYLGLCFPLKGLPNDLSPMTQFIWEEVEGKDGHSLSHLTYEEICRLYEWCATTELSHGRNCARWLDEFGYLFGHMWDASVRFNDVDYRCGLNESDVRWVFWFDN